MTDKFDPNATPICDKNKCQNEFSFYEDIEDPDYRSHPIADDWKQEIDCAGEIFSYYVPFHVACKLEICWGLEKEQHEQTKEKLRIAVDALDAISGMQGFGALTAIEAMDEIEGVGK